MLASQSEEWNKHIPHEASITQYCQDNAIKHIVLSVTRSESVLSKQPMLPPHKYVGPYVAFVMVPAQLLSLKA